MFQIINTVMVVLYQVVTINVLKNINATTSVLALVDITNPVEAKVVTAATVVLDIMRKMVEITVVITRTNVRERTDHRIIAIHMVNVMILKVATHAHAMRKPVMRVVALAVVILMSAQETLTIAISLLNVPTNMLTVIDKNSHANAMTVIMVMVITVITTSPAIITVFTVTVV